MLWIYYVLNLGWIICIASILSLAILEELTHGKSSVVNGLLYYGKYRPQGTFSGWLAAIEVHKRLFYVFYVVAVIYCCAAILWLLFMSDIGKLLIARKKLF
ncbi:hypothetical protein AB6A40_009965 [Gnathostoma spinigerum]|uniref:Uncharacterized protein n=1 Tax=Gnathostoma spinigerum TaxID=75299 RepID=A0ABD6ETS4_9BILA